MRLLKRSIFIIALFAVLSMSTVSMAKSSRVTGEVDGYYCCAIVQYSGNYGTHSVRVDKDYDFGNAAEIYYKFGLGTSTYSYGKLNGLIGKYSASYNKYYGNTSKAAFSMVIKRTWPCAVARAKK